MYIVEAYQVENWLLHVDDDVICIEGGYPDMVKYCLCVCVLDVCVWKRSCGEQNFGLLCEQLLWSKLPDKVYLAH